MLNKLSNYAAESGWIPDPILRVGIKRLLRKRLQELDSGGQDPQHQQLELIKQMSKSAIAESPEKANQQHYELPPEFFVASLGHFLKYSCGFWLSEKNSLDDAELRALELSFAHANLEDGKSVLELGCGWGSFSLFMAERLPNSSITAVSNSSSQAAFIRSKAERLGVNNLQIITADMNDFSTDQTFDRIVSIEMFEHMRNWPFLFSRVSGWLNSDGQFFMHVFAHRDTPYFYEDKGDDDWMTRYFFSGGLMPSVQLPHLINKHLIVDQEWQWEGTHYEATANAWLKKMDQNREKIMSAFVKTYGQENAKIWWMRWRLFYMACAELFGYKDGSEWLVAHYRMRKQTSQTA